MTIARTYGILEYIHAGGVPFRGLLSSLLMVILYQIGNKMSIDNCTKSGTIPSCN